MLKKLKLVPPKTKSIKLTPPKTKIIDPDEVAKALGAEPADYRWIKVKKYADDPSKSWEERYRALEKHHEAESKFLIDHCMSLSDQIDDLIKLADDLEEQVTDLEWPVKKDLK